MAYRLCYLNPAFKVPVSSSSLPIVTDYSFNGGVGPVNYTTNGTPTILFQEDLQAGTYNITTSVNFNAYLTGSQTPINAIENFNLSLTNIPQEDNDPDTIYFVSNNINVGTVQAELIYYQVTLLQLNRNIVLTEPTTIYLNTTLTWSDAGVQIKQLTQNLSNNFVTITKIK
jgi:hypothetical protein